MEFWTPDAEGLGSRLARKVKECHIKLLLELAIKWLSFSRPHSLLVAAYTAARLDDGDVALVWESTFTDARAVDATSEDGAVVQCLQGTNTDLRHTITSFLPSDVVPAGHQQDYATGTAAEGSLVSFGRDRRSGA